MTIEEPIELGSSGSPAPSVAGFVSDSGATTVMPSAWMAFADGLRFSEPIGINLLTQARQIIVHVYHADAHDRVTVYLAVLKPNCS